MKRRNRTADEKIFQASQWQLVWIKFTKHKLAVVAGAILVIIYVCSAGIPEFLAPYNMQEVHREFSFVGPQKISFIDPQGRFHLRPFVYGLVKTEDPVTWEAVYKQDPALMYPISLLVHGEKYKFWGLFDTDVHFIGLKEGTMFLMGTDILGRDIFSRLLNAGRISLSIGFLGVAISFILGNLLGGISGFYAGATDMVIQRVIEFLSSIPTIPLWMSLAAALPPRWPPLRVYFGITVILSILGWTGLARVVRGKLLELREEDFVMAARLSGSSDGRIIVRHLLPSFMSYLIVSVTLAIPGMILGETALSFLSLGLRPPVVSWGVLLQDAQSFTTVAIHPWLLIPGLAVIVVVLCFNLLGDGLRDAADPYR